MRKIVINLAKNGTSRTIRSAMYKDGVGMNFFPGYRAGPLTALMTIYAADSVQPPRRRGHSDNVQHEQAGRGQHPPAEDAAPQDGGNDNQTKRQ